MRILFVYLYGETPQFPIGIGYISGALKAHRHETKLGSLGGKENVTKLLGLISSWKPDIIGFSSMTSTFAKVKELSILIKKRCKDIIIVCGGIHPTLVPDCIIEAPLDAICRGEGEYTFIELIEKLSHDQDYTSVQGFWFKINGKIIKNPISPLIQNLDELPMPDYDLYYSLDLPGKVPGRAEFMFCRGCPFDCTYCSNHSLKDIYQGQKYVRFPSIEKAINELLIVKEKYNINSIVIHDDIFSLNKKWFNHFCEEYKEKIKTPFLCNVRPGTCNKEMFKLLKEANCDYVAIGLESGNPCIRAQILNRKMTNEQILETFKLAHEAGIRTHSFSMLGLPYETPQAIVDTIRLTAKLGDKNTPWNYIFHPYPKTKLAEICQEKGWVEMKSLDFKERSDSVLNLPTIRKKDIRAYFDNFQVLIQIEKQALSKNRYSIAKFFTKLFVFPKLFFIIKFYYYLRRVKSLGLRTSLKRIYSQYLQRNF